MNVVWIRAALRASEMGREWPGFWTILILSSFFSSWSLCSPQVLYLPLGILITHSISSFFSAASMISLVLEFDFSYSVMLDLASCILFFEFDYS